MDLRVYRKGNVWRVYVDGEKIAYFTKINNRSFKAYSNIIADKPYRAFEEGTSIQDTVNRIIKAYEEVQKHATGAN